MADSSSERSQLVWSDEDHRVRVHMTPGVFKNAQRICDYLRGDIRITGQWQTVKLPTILVLHLVCNGAGPTAIIKTFRHFDADIRSISFQEMTKMHSEFFKGNRCLVAAMGEDTELFLVPIKNNNDDVSDGCTFWAYAAMRGAVTHVTEMIDTGRIPLVFDLDETLVLAHTIFSLRNRAFQLSTEISALKESSLPDAGEKLKQLMCEDEVLKGDIAQLQLFMERDRIEINGETIHASHEYVHGEDGQDFLRPIVRTSGRIFTRIDPKRNETSMLIRIRDGWDALSGYLRGEGAEGRQRFKIWVCTAAERAYALEAWRLLDPSAELIPKEEVKRRLICAGKQKKNLFRTFNLGPLHEEPFPHPMMCSKKKLGPLNEGHSEMAMAIIADDRTDVWEKRNQDQILKISPYRYPCTDEKDKDEMQRMRMVFQTVRSQFYFELMEQLAPAVRNALNAGCENETSTQQLLDLMKKAVSIAPYMTQCIAPPPPMLTEVSLKPNDRRSLAETMLVDAEMPIGRPAAKRRRNSKMTKKTIVQKIIQSSTMSIDKESVDPPTNSDAPRESLMSISTEGEDGRQPSSDPPQIEDLMEIVQPLPDDVTNRRSIKDQENASEASIPFPVPTQQDVVPSLSNRTEAVECNIVPQSMPSTVPSSITVASTAAPVVLSSTVTPTPSIETISLQEVFQQAIQTTLPSINPPPAVQELRTSLPQLLPQIVTVNAAQSAQNMPTAGQLQLIPGKVIYMSQTPAAEQASRYAIAQLPDGRLVLQPVHETHQEQPTHVPQMNFVLQNDSVQTNTMPTIQSKQWNHGWVHPPLQSSIQAPQQPHEITGSYARPLNAPNLSVESQTLTIDTGIQPHQLDVPQMTVLQTDNHQIQEASHRYVMMRPQRHSHQAQIPAESKIEYGSLPVSQQPQQFMFPLAPPPPPPPPPPREQMPHPVESIVGNQGLPLGPPRFGNPKNRGGFLQRGNKRQRPLSIGDQRSSQRFAPVLRLKKRGQPKHRRILQRKPQLSKNKHSPIKKQSRQGAGGDASQDFNFVGYMAQLEDELEEEEASEEGEIRD